MQSFQFNVITVQINQFELASITYDTSSIDPAMSSATAFHHEDLSNDSPATLQQTVTGTKQTTQAVTMGFTTTVSNSTSCVFVAWLTDAPSTPLSETTAFTVTEKLTIKTSVPQVVDMTGEKQISDGFSFQFARSSTSTTTVQNTYTYDAGKHAVSHHKAHTNTTPNRISTTVSVPAFSHVIVEMSVASQVRPRFWGNNTAMTTISSFFIQDDVQIPFVAQMYTTAYDWMKRTNVVSEQDINDIPQSLWVQRQGFGV